MKKWTKKELAILNKEGFIKNENDRELEGNTYIKNVGRREYIVCKRECTVDWAKYFRVISNNATGYYDEDEIACLSDLFDEIKKDTEEYEFMEAQEKPKRIDLSGKIMVIDGVNYKLEKA